MDEILSLLVWYRHDPQTNATQLQIVNVGTSKEVHLGQGSCLLRIFNLQDGTIQRCFIRHLASGQEAYVQGGANLRTFVEACILQSVESSSEASGPGEAEEVPNEPQANESGPRPASSTPNGSEADADT